MKLNVFRTTKNEGNFSKEKKLYPNLNTNEIDILYENKINKLIKSTNLNIKKYLVFSNKNKQEINKQTVTITTKKITENIAVLKTKDIALLVESNDDPVIIVSGLNISAIAIGSIQNLNNNILHEMIEILIKETNLAPFEMTFYIGACPNKENYLLDDINILNNKNVWKDSYEKKNNEYYLDIRYAIYNTLLYEIVDPNNIYFDANDTVTNNLYYSDRGNKKGFNFTCVVYQEENE